jgi:hypothetical protein
LIGNLPQVPLHDHLKLAAFHHPAKRALVTRHTGGYGPFFENFDRPRPQRRHPAEPSPTMSIFTKDLGETLLGGLILRVLLPLILLLLGLGGLTEKMKVGGAPVTGITAILYGSGFILWGLSILRFDRTDTPSFSAARFAAHLAGMLVIIAATLTLIFHHP